MKEKAKRRSRRRGWEVARKETCDRIRGEEEKRNGKEKEKEKRKRKKRKKEGKKIKGQFRLFTTSI